MHRQQNFGLIQADYEDQKLIGELTTSSFKCHTETESCQSVIEGLLDDNDEVFLARSEDVLDGPDFNSVILRKQKEQRLRLESVEQKNQNVQTPRCHVCPAQWSVSYRCFDCEWKAQRGGRPRHPLPPSLSPGHISPPIVTLQSLGTTRDSGYEPSPTSAFSFTFTSDEEENLEDEESEDTPPPSVMVGGMMTPPINIPPSSTAINIGVRTRSSRTSTAVKSKHQNKNFVHASEVDKTPIIPRIIARQAVPDTSTNQSEKTETTFRKRSKSAPELGGNQLLLPKTRITVKNGNFIRTPFEDAESTPLHGRNYSLPATTADGRPVFGAPSMPSSRTSREGLIDLAEEDPEGRSGHKRRVLVLALPDLLIDVNTRAPPSPSDESTTSSILSRESSCSSSTSSSSSATYMFGLPSATAKSSDSSGVESSSPRFRPRYRRPRALSCDVTLEVEIGQELRKIADTFKKDTANTQRGMWRTIKESLGRRFSLGETLPIPEVVTTDSVQYTRGTQSLPCTPKQKKNDSDSEEDIERFEWL